MAFLQQSRLHHLQLLTVAALFSLAGAGAVYAQKLAIHGKALNSPRGRHSSAGGGL